MQSTRPLFLSAALAVFALVSMRTAEAHFLWVATKGEGDAVKAILYFSESAGDRNYRLPERVAEAEFRQRTADDKTQALKSELVETDSEIVRQAPLHEAEHVAIEATCQYGIYHGSLLTYFAKHVGNVSHGSDALTRSPEFALDVLPQAKDDKLQLTVLWKGKPLAGVEVACEQLEGEVLEAFTDNAGRVEFAPSVEGLIGIRVGHQVKDAAGEFDGQPYQGAAYYTTLTLPWNANVTESAAQAASSSLPDLPEPIASFGAAVHDGWLYVYGGHTGEPHAHSRENVSPHFRRLNLRSVGQAASLPSEGGNSNAEAGSSGYDRQAWEDLPSQTPLQSPALVAHGDYLYRIGGMTARNAADEDDDLHSVDEFARFDPQSKEWTSLASLPQPRSSHDAVVIGDKLYVIGGWVLSGPGHGEWCPSALVYDLAAENAKWETLPEPDFRRRALAAAEYNGKLAAIGGMTDESEVSPRVDFFDPASGEWTQGPDLPASDMHGFGIAAWNVNGTVYASGAAGLVYGLNETGDDWDEVAELEIPRFFHRLVSAPDGDLLAVAGAAHGYGHVASIERIRITEETASDGKPKKVSARTAQ